MGGICSNEIEIATTRFNEELIGKPKKVFVYNMDLALCKQLTSIKKTYLYENKDQKKTFTCIQVYEKHVAMILVNELKSLGANLDVIDVIHLEKIIKRNSESEKVFQTMTKFLISLKPQKSLRKDDIKERISILFRLIMVLERVKPVKGGEVIALKKDVRAKFLAAFNNLSACITPFELRKELFPQNE